MCVCVCGGGGLYRNLNESCLPDTEQPTHYRRNRHILLLMAQICLETSADLVLPLVANRGRVMLTNKCVPVQYSPHC